MSLLGRIGIAAVSRIADSQDTVAFPLDLLYGPIAGELAQVEDLLQREMRSKYPYVDEMVRYGCLLGGKRLRPALLLLAAKSTGEVTQAASDFGRCD